MSELRQIYDRNISALSQMSLRALYGHSGQSVWLQVDLSFGRDSFAAGGVRNTDARLPDRIFQA